MRPRGDRSTRARRPDRGARRPRPGTRRAGRRPGRNGSPEYPTPSLLMLAHRVGTIRLASVVTSRSSLPSGCVSLRREVALDVPVTKYELLDFAGAGEREG